MLSRIKSSIILSINILIGLFLLCFNTELYHNPSWIISIKQDQKLLFSWNMAFAMTIIFFTLILFLLVDSLILSKRPRCFFTYGIICSVCLIVIHLVNIIILVLISLELRLRISLPLCINLALFSLIFITSLFDWFVCYDLCFHNKF